MKKTENFNILFCGTGGQGVLKAAELVGWAALFSGYHVKKTEVHGMSQRGGSVESHLRFGTHVYSPLVPKGHVDFLVAFDKNEARRLGDFLKPGGAVVTFDRDTRYLNTYIVGLLSLRLPLKEKDWLKALDTVFAGKEPGENKRVFLQARKERG